MFHSAYKQLLVTGDSTSSGVGQRLRFFLEQEYDPTSGDYSKPLRQLIPCAVTRSRRLYTPEDTYMYVVFDD